MPHPANAKNHKLMEDDNFWVEIGVELPSEEEEEKEDQTETSPANQDEGSDEIDSSESDK